MSCEERIESVTVDELPGSSDSVMQMVDQRNRLTSRIGPVPTCTEHGRQPCDLCGESYQPIEDSGPEGEEEGPKLVKASGAFTCYPRPIPKPELIDARPVYVPMPDENEDS